MAAATQTAPALISLEEYPCIYWCPDREFIDGYLEDEPAGEVKHSVLQAQLSNIRVLDPIERTALTRSDGSLQPVNGERIEISDSPVLLDLDAVFSALD